MLQRMALRTSSSDPYAASPRALAKVLAEPTDLSTALWAGYTFSASWGWPLCLWCWEVFYGITVSFLPVSCSYYHSWFCLFNLSRRLIVRVHQPRILIYFGSFILHIDLRIINGQPVSLWGISCVYFAHVSCTVSHCKLYVSTLLSLLPLCTPTLDLLRTYFVHHRSSLGQELIVLYHPTLFRLQGGVSKVLLP